MVEAGWYRAEGDPPDTQRYWDGDAWSGEPIPIPPTAPPTAPPSPTARPAYERPDDNAVESSETRSFGADTLGIGAYETSTYEPSIYEPPVGSPDAAVPIPPDGQSAHPYGRPDDTEIPSGLKTLTIVVSVLKAIPLLVASVAITIIAAVSSNLSNELDDATGLSFEGIIFVALGVILTFVVIAGALLFFQLRGALKGRRSMLLGTASLMAGIDIVFLLGSLNDGSVGGAFIPLAITAAQATIAVWAYKWKPTALPAA